MPERDVNEEASGLVNEATDSEPVSGEELLESAELKRRLAEAKKRAASQLPESPAKQD